ncbi:hypothetical protein [Streptomyces sp. NPDC093225]|uniref:hypothetical protein n=1 Tax=Streptomyces sp. NPDC093225 TaxID=3366034 RepID=UPI0037FE032A
MLEMLQRHFSGDTAADGQIGPDSPAAHLAQLLSEREARLQRELAEAEEAELREAEDARRLAGREERAAAVRRHVAELTAQRDTAYELLDDLAAALGACPACFGTEHTCRWCRGRGAPGFTTPEPALFARLVRPAVVVHARLHRRVPPTRPTEPPPPRERTHP